MGVRGLTTFVDDDEVLSETYYLHDCKLVIDGHSLMFWLCGYHPDSKVNQEYASYGDGVRRFFSGLRQCGVEPLVVFDGPATMEKYDKVLRTLEGNVAAIEGMFHSDDEELNAARLLPPFSLDAIMQLMVDLKVPYASSLADADSEIAALANFYECPILAEDSDYYIFDVKYGYLCLRDFPRHAEEGETKLCCTRFLSERFCRKYAVSQSKLPFLSIILGNDWVVTEIFKDKVFGISKSFHVDRRDFTWRVKTGLIWLSQRQAKDDAAILKELYASIPESCNKNEITAKMKYSLSLYRDLPDISKLTKILYPKALSEKNCESPPEQPVTVEDAVRWCYVHFYVYHLTQFNFVGLPSAIVCDTHKSSPHLCSVEIRNFVYRYLLRRFCLAKEGPKVLCIEEYDFDDGASYGKVRGVNVYTSTCPNCEQRHEFGSPCQTTSVEVCEITVGSVISKFLSVDCEYSFKKFWKKEGKMLLADMNPNFHQRLDVVMLATFYWFRKTSPAHMSVASLLLTLAVIPSMSFKPRKVVLKAPPEQNCSDADNTTSKDKLPRNESQCSSPCERDGKGSNTLNNSPELNVSLRPMWYQKNLAKQEKKKVLASLEKLRLRPPPSALTTKMDKPPETVSQYVGLFGPLAPVASKSGGMYWWTLQDDFKTDMELLHSIAEWQCCLWAVLLLHQAIEYNGLHLGLCDIFGSNLTLHEIHARLLRSETHSTSSQTDLRSYLEHVALDLDAAPATKCNFEMMAKYLLQ